MHLLRPADHLRQRQQRERERALDTPRRANVCSDNQQPLPASYPRGAWPGTRVAIRWPSKKIRPTMSNPIRVNMTVAPSSAPRRAARDAESELSHLEAVLRSLALSQTPPTVLGPNYWRARVLELDRQYMLLASQRARLEPLRRAIDEVETALASVTPRSERVRVAA
jgi:hypothetical protein